MLSLDSDVGDLAAWAKHLAAYPAHIGQHSNKKLAALDDFYRKELPVALSKRSKEGSCFLEKDELVRIVEWKLARGKWRPRLLSFAKSLSEAQVREASSKAFAAMPDYLTTALKEMTSLKGVGPATASAILAAHSPHVAPFMSDEALEFATGTREYTTKAYLRFASILQDKAKEIQERAHEDDKIEEAEQKVLLGFTPSTVEMAIWSSTKDEGKQEAKESKTRKRRKN